MPNLTVSHCFVLVNDQDAALAFYTDVLGLEVRNDVAFDQMRWLTVGPEDQPDLEIGLLQPGGPYNTAEDVTTAREMVEKGLMPGVIFTTADLDATFEQLRAAGAEVSQEPIDQPYGRDCAFRDPSGNHLRFTQPKG